MSVEKWWKVRWICTRLTSEDTWFIVFDAVFHVGEAKYICTQLLVITHTI